MARLEPQLVAGVSELARKALRSQTPPRDWPLFYVEEHDALLVVREWPDGSVTADTKSRSDLESRTGNDDSDQ